MRQHTVEGQSLVEDHVGHAVELLGDVELLDQAAVAVEELGGAQGLHFSSWPGASARSATVIASCCSVVLILLLILACITFDKLASATFSSRLRASACSARLFSLSIASRSDPGSVEVTSTLISFKTLSRRSSLAWRWAATCRRPTAMFASNVWLMAL